MYLQQTKDVKSFNQGEKNLPCLDEFSKTLKNMLTNMDGKHIE